MPWCLCSLLTCPQRNPRGDCRGAFRGLRMEPEVAVPFSSRWRWSGLTLDGRSHLLGAPDRFELGPLAARAASEMRKGRRVLAFAETEGTAGPRHGRAGAAAQRPFSLWSFSPNVAARGTEYGRLFPPRRSRRSRSSPATTRRLQRLSPETQESIAVHRSTAVSFPRILASSSESRSRLLSSDGFRPRVSAGSSRLSLHPAIT